MYEVGILVVADRTKQVGPRSGTIREQSVAEGQKMPTKRRRMLPAIQSDQAHTPQVALDNDVPNVSDDHGRPSGVGDGSKMRV